jgi:hypothetical protein
MTYTRRVGVTALAISFRGERDRIGNEFRRFLCQYACERFLISKDAPVLRVLEAAARELKAVYGNKFLALTLGGSTALGLSHPRSDVDYFVLMDNIRGDRAAHIVDVIDGHLRRANFIPCNQSLGQVFIRSPAEGGRRPYEFSLEEFNYGLTVEGLCRAIKTDNCSIAFATPDNTIDRLNELLRTPSFIAVMLPIKVGQDKVRFERMSKRDFVERALRDQNQEFQSLPWSRQESLVHDNRQFLYRAYSQVCPNPEWLSALYDKLPAHPRLLVQLFLGGTPVAGKAELMKQVILEEYSNILPAMIDQKQPGWEKRDAVLCYRRSLGLDSEYVVKRFLRSRCGQLVTVEALDRLKEDQLFKAELEQLAKPYLAEREKRSPFPQEISDIYAAIAGS